MTTQKIEKKLEQFARYIWKLSPHNFYNPHYIGKVNKNIPLHPYKVMDYIKKLAKELNK